MTRSEAHNKTQWYKLPYRIRRKINRAIKKGCNYITLKSADYATTFFDNFITPMDIINANDILKELGYDVAQNFDAYGNSVKYECWITW